MSWTSWFRRAEPSAPTQPEALAPQRVTAPAGCAGDFELQAALSRPHGLPLMDWNAVQHWLAPAADEADRARCWGELERAWLLHLRDALGGGYGLRQQDDVLLLSALPARPAAVLMDFVKRSRERVLQLLDGLGETPPWGFEILIVFDEADDYYRYTSGYLGEGGEYGLSSGMHINAGCSHFVTTRAELQSVEPVVVHELTHACLAHLPIPAWLNEGLAVSCERRLCPPPGLREPPLSRHQAYWTPERLQDFWCGRSFLATDEGQELSYALATLLVHGLAADGWPRFRAFALQAHADDAGERAAQEQLGIALGAALASLLDLGDAVACAPQPGRWDRAPERGAF